MRNQKTAGQRGFTLIEAVMVMVITGIVATMVATFLQMPVRTYFEIVGRASATDLADNAMRRLTRDLRLALPNSIRTGALGTASYIEYLETRAGLRYLGDDDVNTPLGGLVLDWNAAPGAATFTVVGGIPTGRLAPVVNSDSVVIYNLGAGQEPGDAYNCVVECNRALISAVDTAASTITIATNPFAAQSAAGTALKSPSKRFHIITSPVTYGCDSTTRRLTRYWGYAISAAQPMPPSGGSSALLADNVTGCTFTYMNTMATQRSGVVGITLKIRIPDSAAEVSLQHQIHVDNTP